MSGRTLDSPTPPTGPKDSATGVQAAACAIQEAGSDREAVVISERVRRGASGVAASERRKVCKKLNEK